MWTVYAEALIMRTPMLDSSPLGGMADVTALGDMLVGVGHVGIYGEPGEIDSPEFCGGGGSDGPSCRTDVAVWIGAWSSD